MVNFYDAELTFIQSRQIGAFCSEKITYPKPATIQAIIIVVWYAVLETKTPASSPPSWKVQSAMGMC